MQISRRWVQMTRWNRRRVTAGDERKEASENKGTKYHPWWLEASDDEKGKEEQTGAGGTRWLARWRVVVG